MQRIIYIIALCFLPPFLIELQSGNIPLLQFFQPATLIFLLTIGYGLPVLIIREAYIRYQLGLPSLLLLGIVYGLYNEGLIARTLIRDTALPIDAFNGEVMVGGINIGFAAIISLTHALQSVVYPIVIFGFLFPTVKHISLISGKVASMIGLVLAVVGTAAFFRIDAFGQGPVLAYVSLVLSMLVFLIMAYMVRNWSTVTEERMGTKRTSFLFGVSLTGIIIAPSFVAFLPVHPIAPLVTFGIVCSILWRTFARLRLCSHQHMLSIGVGHMVAGILVSIVLISVTNLSLIPIVLPGYVLVSIFLALIYRRYVH